MIIMERKKPMPNTILFSKIDDEDFWNIMGNNIFQHVIMEATPIKGFLRDFYFLSQGCYRP
jgi:hypothetical protein